MSRPHWRRAHITDLEAISAIAARIHPDLPERPDVLAEKMRLSPDGCRVLATGSGIAGYGLAHPWMQQQIPPLDGFLGQLPEAADCLYVHDVAVLPDARGGVARAYVAEIEQLARSSGITTLALVSVYGTRVLWERLGFQPVTPDAALRAKLASYGASATYMLRELAR
ncbi:GNAT family N-acetyltransferase [Bradyrhizobium sp. WYCCWR 13023]|uniref:GNAT family N-acetyltransferase n=1 Tax=Bradyrhizobium zhengyangense TaxID=2911009 RepID=A0A9X1RDT4_9BRAD|nr:MULTISPECIES: GNAT family N-acetyltransferase [Bradyrhizobium]MCG2630904.1 GNAT family N-acetyltransferase [Bradyrhizobium zhengyangense]MCG2644523.1 GNAT family N-acetyltransferase [Bradyrhizobium zhengyangense]MCG2672123.1 GNAT family N-acetyltransferase [Bradyrhizobium zhengyangense]MDA9519692.1 acetyltransferase [Bradyrhizobium sp. CCBAU 11434]